MENEVSQSATEMRKTEGADARLERRVFRPVADIVEKDGRILLACEMPGVDQDGVEVTLERRELSIRGRIPAQPRQGFRLIHVEYAEGDYERVFTLSEDVDGDAMTAVFQNGVLTLELPLAAAAQPKRIEVKSA